MGYLFGEIVLYLVGAGFIGFVVGWFVRGVTLNKTVDNSELVKEEKAENPVTTETNITEVNTTEIKQSEEQVEEIQETSNIPTLLSKAPQKGQDSLVSIKGIGPVMEKKLNDLGVYTFEQIASWTEEQAVWIGTEVAFANKVNKEAWVQQAKELLKAQ